MADIEASHASLSTAAKKMNDPLVTFVSENIIAKNKPNANCEMQASIIKLCHAIELQNPKDDGSNKCIWTKLLLAFVGSDKSIMKKYSVFASISWAFYWPCDEVAKGLLKPNTIPSADRKVSQSFHWQLLFAETGSCVPSKNSAFVTAIAEIENAINTIIKAEPVPIISLLGEWIACNTVQFVDTSPRFKPSQSAAYTSRLEALRELAKGNQVATITSTPYFRALASLVTILLCIDDKKTSALDTAVAHILKATCITD
jgi:hypothetical protein